MINFSVHTKENHVKAWDEIKLAYKLHKLAQAEKNTTWLHRNLSVAKSSFIERLFWFVAKHFDWMRRAFYDIDLKRSQAILQELRPQIYTAKNLQLIQLYQTAVAKFNSLFPHHQVLVSSENDPIPDINDTLSQETIPDSLAGLSEFISQNPFPEEVPPANNPEAGLLTPNPAAPFVTNDVHPVKEKPWNENETVENSSDATDPFYTKDKVAEYVNRLNQNAIAIVERLTAFPVVDENVLELCAKCLIGLANYSNFYEDFFPFPCLEPFQKNPKYMHISGTMENNITKLSAAIQLYFFKAFQSPAWLINEEALYWLKKLVDYFQNEGGKAPNSSELKNALFVISKSYYESNPNKANAQEELDNMWKSKIPIN